MIRCFRVFVLAALVATVSACAGTKPIPLDRAQANIKTIGIVTPEVADAPTSFIAASPGRNFGLIGALIDAGVQANREQALAAALQTQQFSAQNTFSDKLAEAVKAQGYDVVMIPATRVKKGEFLDKYPQSDGVDAYMDVVLPVWGYMAAGVQSSAPFRPFVAVKCQLVRSQDASVLMQDRVTYNPINERASDGVTLSPDPTFAFATSDMMETQAEHTAEGLRVAMTQTATAIGVLLR